MAPRGAVAEWLGRGLQSLVHQFESGRRLSLRVLSARLRVSAAERASFYLQTERSLIFHQALELEPDRADLIGKGSCLADRDIGGIHVDQRLFETLEVSMDVVEALRHRSHRFVPTHRFGGRTVQGRHGRAGVRDRPQVSALARVCFNEVNPLREQREYQVREAAQQERAAWFALERVSGREASDEVVLRRFRQRWQETSRSLVEALRALKT